MAGGNVRIRFDRPVHILGIAMNTTKGLSSTAQKQQACLLLGRSRLRLVILAVSASNTYSGADICNSREERRMYYSTPSLWIRSLLRDELTRTFRRNTKDFFLMTLPGVRFTIFLHHAFRSLEAVQADHYTRVITTHDTFRVANLLRIIFTRSGSFHFSVSRHLIDLCVQVVGVPDSDDAISAFLKVQHSHYDVVFFIVENSFARLVECHDNIGSFSALGAIYERFEELPTLDFDFIIIGGGTAGNVLANRLTEDPNTSVLVLEAGGSTADVLLTQVPFFSPNVSTGTAWDWNFTTTEQSGLLGRSISYPRGFGLGGSSAVNYMLYTRGSSQDYDRYAQITRDSGWGWEALQPYMRRASSFPLNERFVAPSDHHNTSGQFDPAVHGFHGVNAVSLPGYQRGTDGSVLQTTMVLSSEFPFNVDYNSGYQLGIGWTPYTIGNGTRSSSQTSYLGPSYIARPNLHVLIHARVTRVLQSNIAKTSGIPTFNTVEFTQNTGATTHTIAPSRVKEIIFSAGSIGTPHILLHSGIGDRTELKALGITPTLDLPDVGKNLTDHPMLTLSFYVNSTDTMENIYFRNATFQAEALAEWKANRTGFLTAGIASQVGFLRVPDNAGVLEGEPSAGNETAHYELAFTAQPIPDTGNYFCVTTVVLCPLSRGDVTINSTDPLDPPRINPNYLSHSQDLAVMRYAIASAKKFVTASVWEDYVLEIMADIKDDDDVRNAVGCIYHPVGTASMSPEGADWGVVDPDLKLKGARGVRVVDASILPFLPAAHTQAAVYIIAERAADLIKGA
ncbi:uncharacterized protein BT62DRAFT_1007126 [Guyanagaster necrorhizus]|uniref:Glucose-methanol-choline oxidoreductase N-terminal domain-containing protein n=1 Tax=Guyanagaster necrorhizus TaxID=856835 RepID=A0A9P7VRI1_9AGAR|nr:uncharacterized protein BT62DRAFT_1007126 [Guyanagaster necrorhizus MCA 3950]KAG7445390.1 hypothetical protein BT62DRAFT_1007126 [Guyanagaster necrorhizus MCA 3950]